MGDTKVTKEGLLVQATKLGIRDAKYDLGIIGGSLNLEGKLTLSLQRQTINNLKKYVKGYTEAYEKAYKETLDSLIEDTGVYETTSTPIEDLLDRLGVQEKPIVTKNSLISLFRQLVKDGIIQEINLEGDGVHNLREVQVVLSPNDPVLRTNRMLGLAKKLSKNYPNYIIHEAFGLLVTLRNHKFISLA